VPITGENRVLAYFGLQIINSFPRPGIKAILDQVNKTELTITDVVFVVAPRINAAGRMKHGNYAVTLLVETDFEKAHQFAQEIDEYNSDRREEDKRITEEALIQIEQKKEQNSLTTVVYQEDWHKGVIGIVASRLTETYYRPTLVFTRSGDKLAASARSVRGFDVYNAIEACSKYIEQFGGHKYAAGLTMKEENYEAFKQAFEDEVSNTIDRSLLIPEIKIDTKIDLKDLTPKFYRIIKQFAPYGPGNMTPVFLTENLRDTGYGKCVGSDKTHLRMTVTQQTGNNLVAIGFGMGDKVDLITKNKLFKAVYSVDENEWKGNISLQLKLRDIKAQDSE
jgi:single-stranded-DNA-specific exonuclease